MANVGHFICTLQSATVFSFINCIFRTGAGFFFADLLIMRENHFHRTKQEWLQEIFSWFQSVMKEEPQRLCVSRWDGFKLLLNNQNPSRPHSTLSYGLYFTTECTMRWLLAVTWCYIDKSEQKSLALTWCWLFLWYPVTSCSNAQ